MDQFTKEGRKLRPRKSAGYQSAEKVEYHPGEGRSNYGEHKNYGEGRSNYSSDRRPRQNNGYGRSNYGNRSYGEHRSNYSEGNRSGEGSEQRSSYGENRSYGFSSRPRQNGGYNRGEGRSSYGSRNTEGRSYGENRGGYGENRGGYGDRRPRQGGYGKPSGGRGGYGAKKNFKKGAAPIFTKASEEGMDRMISRRPVINGSQTEEKFEVPMSNEVRLNKFIANSGVCSRREADTLIQAGVVTVNGEVVTELGTKINVFDDDVRFNGERLKGEEKVYIVMNKPKGYVTTASDPHAEKTVIDLIKGCSARVYPVGRLDKNTTGILMLTNDGEIAERLTHPSYDKKKIYQVAIDKPLSQEDYEKILSGVTLTDGEVKADELEFVDENDHRKLGIEIHSGKNRVVRRIFESLGYSVKALDRVYFAGLTKKGLKKGEWRYLTEGETNILKMGAYV